MFKCLWKPGLFLLLGIVAWGHLLPMGDIDFSRQGFIGTCFGQSESERSGNLEEKDIQWFREEMKISPKYLNEEEGVLGMSWTHFFTMLFLVFFFITAVSLLIVRHRRTKQLLNVLLKEEKRGPDS